MAFKINFLGGKISQEFFKWIFFIDGKSLPNNVFNIVWTNNDGGFGELTNFIHVISHKSTIDMDKIVGVVG